MWNRWRINEDVSIGLVLSIICDKRDSNDKKFLKKKSQLR